MSELGKAQVENEELTEQVCLVCLFTLRVARPRTPEAVAGKVKLEGETVTLLCRAPDESASQPQWRSSSPAGAAESRNDGV